MGDELKKKDLDDWQPQDSDSAQKPHAQNICIESHYSSNYDRLFSGQLSSEAEEGDEYDLESIYDPVYQENIRSSWSAPSSAVASVPADDAAASNAAQTQTKSAASSKRFFGASKSKAAPSSKSVSGSAPEESAEKRSRVVDLCPQQLRDDAGFELQPEDFNLLCKNDSFVPSALHQDLLLDLRGLEKEYSIEDDLDLLAGSLPQERAAAGECLGMPEFWACFPKDLCAVAAGNGGESAPIFLPLISWKYAGSFDDSAELLNVGQLMNSLFYFKSCIF